MPKQETFLEEEANGRKLQVVKTYDAAFAREAFESMDDIGLSFLRDSLHLETQYEPEDLPLPGSADYTEVLWEEVEAGSREDWNKFSYFVVLMGKDPDLKPVYVSSEWPSARDFAKQLTVAHAQA
jgi:hypothetical protein